MNINLKYPLEEKVLIKKENIIEKIAVIMGTTKAGIRSTCCFTAGLN